MLRLRTPAKFNTEPCAVAPDAGVTSSTKRMQELVCCLLATNQVFFRESFLRLSNEIDSSIRRIHHPGGAAPLGTPVRARFCNAATPTQVSVHLKQHL
jgi:hypothetical protein